MSKNDSEDSDEVEFIDLNTNNTKETSKIKNRNNSKLEEYSMCRKINKVTSRRKTVHKVIHENDEIMFESYPKLTDLSKNSVERQTKTMPKLAPCSSSGSENDKKSSLISSKIKNFKKDTTHPGIEHMHRIAFLKACINYMLISVGKEAMDFEKTGVTLSKLVNKYNGITPKEDEVIGISD